MRGAVAYQPGLQDRQVSVSEQHNLPMASLPLLFVYDAKGNCIARYCEADGSSQTLNCGNNDTIIYVDLARFTWYCGHDDGRCPGAFQVQTVIIVVPAPSRS